MAEEHRTTHDIAIDAPPRTVYELIADVTAWPRHFRPNLHVEYVERPPAPGAGTERLRIWATANDEVKNWTSRRDLDARAMTVSFRQEVSQPPVAEMSGRWEVTAQGAGSKLELRHAFRAVDDDPAGVAWTLQALDRNSASELAGIKEAAERRGAVDELTFSFEDTVRAEGGGAGIYGFLERADLWPRRLPHVSRVVLAEDVPGIQVMSMDTRTADGSTHTTQSVRICFGDRRTIVYKQTTLPALMAVHTGRWTVRDTGEGVVATSQHTVVLRPSAIEPVLGAERTVADARKFVHHALSANSTATLGRAVEFARSHAPRAVAGGDHRDA